MIKIQVQPTNTSKYQRTPNNFFLLNFYFYFYFILTFFHLFIQFIQFYFKLPNAEELRALSEVTEAKNG